MHRDRQWLRSSPGDLVSFTIDDDKLIGVVVDVYPANIYEKEVCSILVANHTYHVASVYLRLLIKSSDSASIFNGIPSRMESTGT